MAIEVLIPKLGMTMTEGTVAEWYVHDGGEVKTGEPVYRLETEKIEMDVEAEGDGTLRHLVPVDTTLEPGAVVAYIMAPGDSLPAGVATAAPSPAAALPAASPNGAGAAPAAAPPVTAEDGRVPATPAARRLAQERGVALAAVIGTGPAGRITEADVLAAAERAAAAPAAAAPAAEPPRELAASPLARKLAESLGVDLTAVRGTGPGGRITREDVEAAAQPAAAAAPALASPAPVPPAAGETIPIRGMRKAIFERMHASLQEMAQLTLALEVWMDEAVKLRTQLVEEWAADGVKPSYTDLVIKAVAKALRRHPNVNAQVEGNALRLLQEVHVGMAVALPAGLVVPVIRNAGDISLKEIAAESSRLAAAARDGKLSMDEMTGGTFSVTTLGMYGVDMFTPIINPPNVGILGVGRIHDGVAWEGDRPVKRQQMTLSLTWDHRVLDGAPAAEFAQAVKSLLEAPYRLLV